MRIRSLVDAWNRFFFEPRSPLPVCFFRIVYGCMVTLTLLLLRGEWGSWYGTHAWVSLAAVHQLEPGPRLNLFAVIPQNDFYLDAFFWVFLAGCLFLIFGFLTRPSAVIVFVCLTSLHQRNLLINHGGDTFLRVAGFFLIFAPAGAALSIDRLIRVRCRKDGPKIQPRSPWAQRMIQFELSTLYLMSFWWKSLGQPWIDGTALYYVLHLNDVRRFPLPAWAQQQLILKLGSWLTLALEFGLGTLVWVKELRYPLLLAGILFHLTLEYALNIPMFQWDILAGYILFVDPAHLERASEWARKIFARMFSNELRGHLTKHFGTRPASLT